jgi:peroxiredoxin
VSNEHTLRVGDPAPDFTLKGIGLQEVSLHALRGKNVVIEAEATRDHTEKMLIHFYPLDWTPG